MTFHQNFIWKCFHCQETDEKDKKYAYAACLERHILGKHKGVQCRVASLLTSIKFTCMLCNVTKGNTQDFGRHALKHPDAEESEVRQKMAAKFEEHHFNEAEKDFCWKCITIAEAKADEEGYKGSRKKMKTTATADESKTNDQAKLDNESKTNDQAKLDDESKTNDQAKANESVSHTGDLPFLESVSAISQTAICDAIGTASVSTVTVSSMPIAVVPDATVTVSSMPVAVVPDATVTVGTATGSGRAISATTPAKSRGLADSTLSRSSLGISSFKEKDNEGVAEMTDRVALGDRNNNNNGEARVTVQTESALVTYQFGLRTTIAGDDSSSRYVENTEPKKLTLHNNHNVDLMTDHPYSDEVPKMERLIASFQEEAASTQVDVPVSSNKAVSNDEPDRAAFRAFLLPQYERAKRVHAEKTAVYEIKKQRSDELYARMLQLEENLRNNQN
jgi:hypothetical protein